MKKNDDCQDCPYYYNNEYCCCYGTYVDDDNDDLCWEGLKLNQNLIETNFKAIK